MSIRVRFAPSPTGKVHIGNIRTAIFNWLHARHSNGEFIIRVEDTDKERSTQEAIDKLFECLEWLGIDYDGELYFQSHHEDDHKAAILKLVNENKAYIRAEANGEQGPTLFRIPFNLEDCNNIRTVGTVEQNIHPEVPVQIDYTGITFAQVSRKGKPVEFSGCIAGFKDLTVYNADGEQVYSLIDEDVNAFFSEEKSIKLENCAKVVYTRREIFYTDIVKGELSKPLDSIKDLVVARSDGSPIFHLANVWDDIEQQVTHIIRGDDHVENTYRHILLFYIMGVEAPKYGHMPMIVNKQGKPYSKRDGDAFVGDFQTKGILSDAMFNYLSLLGWSPGDDREKMSKQELIEAFTLERVKSSPAQFDMNKLLNMNGMYISELSAETFFELTKIEAEKQGWYSDVIREKFQNVAAIMQGRTKQIAAISDWKYFFFNDSPLFSGNTEEELKIEDKAYAYDAKAVKKVLGKEDNIAGIDVVAKNIDSLSDFSADSINSALRNAENECGMQEGKLNQAVRVSVTGKSGGADLIETLSIIGKEGVLERIEKVIKAVK